MASWAASTEAAGPAAAATLRCLQRAGELMYVPEGWHHATLNHGETLAVARQSQVGRSEWLRLRLLAKQLTAAQARARGGGTSPVISSAEDARCGSGAVGKGALIDSRAAARRPGRRRRR
jgi:hypothetical protein